ncbi:hypothetical protein [Streptomyces sp. NPDC008001]|uniref:hypothetical protein n=1 Tax=Streptomyces sp. NPDC008001 TaxID=3364804 RepID=UPI0036E59471
MSASNPYINVPPPNPAINTPPPNPSLPDATGVAAGNLYSWAPVVVSGIYEAYKALRK